MHVCDVGVGSLAGGGVGRLDRGTQLAKYLSSSSSVMSLWAERAGEYCIVAGVVCLMFFFFLSGYLLDVVCRMVVVVVVVVVGGPVRYGVSERAGPAVE